MKRFYAIFVAMLVGATSLFAQTNYTVTFSANVEMDKIQVKNLHSGVTKTLAKSDKVITLQKNAKQEQHGGSGTPIESVDQFEFLSQTASNEVVVNMEKAGHLNLTLYSSNGSFVARYSNNVDAGQNAFQIGASSGVYVLVASANNQTASLKIMLTQSSQPSILEVLTDKPEPLLKSIDDVITFDEGDRFEFTGYYYSQTRKNTTVITGDETITFSFTKVTEPTVTTVAATDIEFNDATVGGKVTSDNGASVTERGVCWSTTATPAISNSKRITSGTGTGTFSVTLSSLSDGTTYYVRAYAKNSVGIAYGNTVTFTTVKKVAIVNGAIQKAFSVSATKKVYFSQGNLQYNPYTGDWRFAEKQNDIKAVDGYNISSTYNGWIALFGYGTSGYRQNNKPYNKSTNYDDYPSQDIAGTVYDWGVACPISNGGNKKGLWRTLTKAEWIYLFSTRADAQSKVGRATVNNVKGLIVLPDEWTTPKGITFRSFESLMGAMHGEDTDYSTNTYTESDWLKMEMSGAVFLPCGGYRDGLNVKDFGSVGRYWSASVDDEYSSWCLDIAIHLNLGRFSRYYGNSVRLVQDVK